MEFITDILLDTTLDSLRMLPFLFVAFLLLEALEHYSTAFINNTLAKINKAGPLVGCPFWLLPQRFFGHGI